MPDDARDQERRTPAGAGATSGAQAELAGQQLAFYRALADRDIEIATWYLGALAAVANPANPERLVHASHSIRELMGKLHTILDVPVKAEATNKLGNVFDTMTGRWEKAKRLTSCFDDGNGWDGDIDDHARRGFAAVEEAIAWQQENRPKRKEQTRSTLRALDVSGRSLPEWIEDTFVALWADLHDHFVRWCHHGGAPTEEEFFAALEQLEKMVLDRLNPRTFSDMATIDDLIREAESR